MKGKCVTILTTEPFLHRGAVFSTCRNLALSGNYPVILLPEPDDKFGEVFKFTKLSIDSFIHDVFKVMSVTAHIQMQDHDPDHRKLVEIAQKDGVLTFIIQHGLTNQTPWLVGDSIAEYMFAWSEREKGKLADYYPSERIIVTGNPRYDYIPKVDNPNKDKILFATNSFECSDGDVPLITRERSREFVLKFLDVVMRFPEKTFILKTHPSPFDDANFYLDIIKELGIEAPNLFMGQKDIDIFQLIEQCGCVITYPYSSVQADAPASGVPVIDIGDDFDLAEEITRIDNGQAPRSYQYDDIPHDNESGKRIVEHISRIVDEKATP